MTADGCTSELFEIKYSIKQVSVIAPMLFPIFISTVLHIVRDALLPGISLTYRFDGNVFN